MFWNRRKSIWPIDPLNVELGSVVEPGGRNLNRTHVRVKYHGESTAQFVPLVGFVRHCVAAMRQGESVGIDHLRVAPILKQRHAEFFDRLTDWAPAVQMVRQARVGPPRRELWKEDS